MEIVADCHLWCVGFWTLEDGITSFTLAEELTPTARIGDVDGDGTVDFRDLLSLLASWGACTDPCPPSCAADFDDDCAVGFADLLILLAHWG